MKALKLVLLSSVLSSAVWAGPKDVLHIYNWSGSLSDAILRQFEKSCDCRVVQNYYGDNEEMLAKLAAAGGEAAQQRIDAFERRLDASSAYFGGPSPGPRRGARKT